MQCRPIRRPSRLFALFPLALSQVEEGLGPSLLLTRVCVCVCVCVRVCNAGGDGIASNPGLTLPDFISPPWRFPDFSPKELQDKICESKVWVRG